MGSDDKVGWSKTKSYVCPEVILFMANLKRKKFNKKMSREMEAITQ